MDSPIRKYLTGFWDSKRFTEKTGRRMTSLNMSTALSAQEELFQDSVMLFWERPIQDIFANKDSLINTCLMTTYSNSWKPVIKSFLKNSLRQERSRTHGQMWMLTLDVYWCTMDSLNRIITLYCSAFPEHSEPCPLLCGAEPLGFQSRDQDLSLCLTSSSTSDYLFA